MRMFGPIHQKLRWLKLDISVLHKGVKDIETKAVYETEFEYDTIQQDEKKHKVSHRMAACVLLVLFGARCLEVTVFKQVGSIE